MTKKKKCFTCSKEFIQYNSIDKFCSYNCKSKVVKPKLIKRKDNPGQLEFNINKRKYWKEIVEKEGFLSCRNCGKSNTKFETHHIIFRSEKPNHKYLHSRINMILLCFDCHDLFHQKKSQRNKLIEKRNLDKIFGKDIVKN